jgi:hypothetical protein
VPAGLHSRTVIKERTVLPRSNFDNRSIKNAVRRRNLATKPRKFGGRVRSDLSGLKGSDAVSGETAEKVRQQFRTISKRFGHLLLENSRAGKEPVRTWLDGIAEAIRPMYRPKYAWRPMMEIDRFGSSVGGLPYVTDEYPWPECGTRPVREPMNPLVQLNLGEISEQTGVEVGSGLLQVWRHSPGDQGYPDIQLRVIEAADVRGDAELKSYPKAYMDRIASQWTQKVASERVLDEFFGDQKDDAFDYMRGLAIKGLIWGKDMGELRQLDPWWAGGEGAGYGPWQITGWQRHGFALPEACIVDEFDDFADAEDGTTLSALFGELRVLRGILVASRTKQIQVEDRKIGCQDSLFGLATARSSEGRDALNMVSDGWQSLFSLAGPMDDGEFADTCTIWLRKQDGKFEYELNSDFRWRHTWPI